MEIISAKYILTLEDGAEPIEDGAIAIELGKIEAVGSRNELRKTYAGALEIEHGSHTLMPGLINAHCHLDLTNFYESNRSLLSEQPARADYTDWLIGIMDYRRNASTTEIITGIQKGAQQAIDSGTTCIGDSTTFEGTYNIFDEMGIRAIIYNDIYSGKAEMAQDLFENALAIVEKYFDPSRNARINVGLSPFSPYLLSRNLLRIISKHAQDSEIPLKIHASESFAEMEFFFDSKGPIGEKVFPSIGWREGLPPAHQKTPVGYLGEIGFLNASPAIVGGIHLSEKCFDLIAKNMCRIIYCPTNNSYFGHGTLPLAKLQNNGIPVGMGTGATHKPQGFSMWDEMREALKMTPGSPTPKEIMQMATIGSARVLGLENQTGTLTKGKMADYIVVDLPPGYEIEKSYIYGALIRNTHHFNVRKTVVAGEVLKSI